MRELELMATGIVGNQLLGYSFRENTIVCLPTESMLAYMHECLKSFPNVRSTTLASVLVDGKRRVWLSLHINRATLDNLSNFTVVWIGEFIMDDLDAIPRNVLIIDSKVPRQTNAPKLALSYPFNHALA